MDNDLVLAILDHKLNTAPGKNRSLTSWDFVWLKDSQGEFLVLRGIVTAGDKEAPLAPGASFRMTMTSPIVSIDNGVVVTTSGSRYHLQSPSTECAEFLELLGEPLTFDRVVEYIKQESRG